MKIIIATHDFYFQQGAEVLFNSCEALGVEHFNSKKKRILLSVIMSSPDSLAYFSTGMILPCLQVRALQYEAWILFE